MALVKPLADAAETRSSEVLDVLAAAHAETGQFPLAIETAKEVIELEAAAGQTEKAAEIEERLRPYRRRKEKKRIFPPVPLIPPLIFPRGTSP